MKKLDQEDIDQLLTDNRISKRLLKDLRYSLEGIDWVNEEFITLRNRQGNEGVFLYDSKVLQFSLAKRIARSNGRMEAIICDLCATWQSGPRSAVITFQRAGYTSSFLVCGDLECSKHVRGLTSAAKVSRSQLREQMSTRERVKRLDKNIENKLFASE